ncbi:hypothetical protein D9C73_002222 [Collichthys lucidus]|uniref:Uncharacterized protein n=1 Tax=Collichthys lucidus TaxID=240159 RepID=A0A4U5U3Z2_COLLU|nr:hypothetical protein D9C73_002222 [Collichthys lucidus]
MITSTADADGRVRQREKDLNVQRRELDKCFVSVSMADKVGSGEDVNTSSATEEEEILASSHEDQQTDKEPLSFLPPLPHLSSLPSTVPPPSDQAFLQAAAIFQQLRTEKSVTKQRLHYGKKKKTDTPQPETGDETPQRRAYHLAFNTLKCVKSLIIVVWKIEHLIQI